MKNCGTSWFFIYNNESYLSINHVYKHINQSKEGKDGNIKPKSVKGKRMIIAHAISGDGPLVTNSDDNTTIDELLWNRNTPHTECRNDGKTTTELL